MEADYILKLKDGQEVKLLYMFGTFRLLSEKLGIEYEDLMKGCLPVEQGGTGSFLKLNNMPKILLAGAETYSKQNKEPFLFTPEDADLWMDGIDWSKDGVLGEIYVLFSCKLFKVDPKSIEVKKEQQNGHDEEKKSEEMEVIAMGNL